MPVILTTTEEYDVWIPPLGTKAATASQEPLLRRKPDLKKVIAGTGIETLGLPWQVRATLGATPWGYTRDLWRAVRPDFTGLS
ncbi:hypothetical protein XH86_03620 [Bradyrhizobium guangdongense]|nr:hypothetical protein X265_03625 [Bradyrhizobium guangdongense]QOZ57940.1 hypothetical protein XH86_03620 [Bradyrhizobium guangdongense]